MSSPKFLPHFAATMLAATMLVAPLPAQAAVGNCVVTTAIDQLDPVIPGSLRDCANRLGTPGYEDGINISFSVESVSLVAPVVFDAGLVEGGVNLTGPVTISPHAGFSTVTELDFTFDRLMFFFIDGYATLTDLTVTDAPFGAVFGMFTAPIRIVNSTFTNNSALAFVSVAPEGAAVLSDSSVTIEGSTFSGNSVDADGGAVEAAGDIVVINSSFTNNSSLNEDGGAIWGGEDVYIYDSHFEGNYAEYYAGAVRSAYDLLVVRSSFVSNEAGEYGGAIYGSADEDGAETYIFHSTFYDNEAGDLGGALYQQDEDAFATFSTFVDNTAGDTGSAIYASGEDISVFGNIFANSQSSDVTFLYASEDKWDWGGNVFTGAQSFDFAPYVEFDGVAYVENIISDYESLKLGNLVQLDNGTFGFIPGTSSVAGSLIDPQDVEPLMEAMEDFESLRGDLYLDMLSEDEEFIDQSGNPTSGLLSAGSLDFESELPPVPYYGPVVTNDPQTAAAGSTVTYTGSDLDDVTSATIAGMSSTIVSKSPSTLTLRVPTGLALGQHDVDLYYGTTEVLTLQNGLIIENPIKVWTQLQTDNTVKMYAKNIIGEGKIQFFHNGNEIAWVRASNALNPKLREANGSHYLVRTRELVAGKNAFEIYQDGTRIWRAAYSR